MFDLEKALAAWRRSLAFNPAYLPEDVEELERHLRDQVAALVAREMDEEAAFHRALGQMGGYGAVEDEYRKVYWGKRRRRGELLQEATWKLTMLKNYVKIALRNVRQQKLYAVINVFGLAVGLAFCTLIFLYVHDELTFDTFHERADRIYRVYRARHSPDGGIEGRNAWLPMPLGPAMQADLPEIAHFARLRAVEYFVRAGRETVEEEILFADAAFFDLFSFPLLQGDPNTALANPGNVVITEATARTYFGDENPMGRILQIRFADRFEDFVVTGLAKDPPGNSSIRFGLLVPFSRLMRLEPAAVDDWHWNGFFTYVLLQENAFPADLEAKLESFVERYYANDVQQLREQGRWTGDGLPVSFHLQSLTDLHLNTGVTGHPPPGNPLYSYILGSLALIILAIACINFMTLTLGRSARRAREIGIRKVVGARRAQLLLQFEGEALLQSLLALTLGLGLAALVLPTFNALAGKTLQLDPMGHASGLLALFAMVIGSTLLAGGYPALVLSGLRPVETLTNRLRLGGAGLLMRSLVVVQFALSVFLLFSTFVMLDQLRYIRTMDLGFDKEQVVVIPVQGLEGQRVLGLFRDQLAGHRDIAGMTGINNAFAQGHSEWSFTHRGEPRQVHVYRGDAHFLEVLGMDLAAGRNFDPDRATDSTHAVIINEAMVRDFGWTEPVGQVVSGLNADDPTRDPTVIGVVKDFNFRSLHRPVEPMMLSLSMSRINHLLVRIRPGDMPGALAVLRATWEKVVPDVPFTFSFLDEDVEGQYRAEDRWSKIIGAGSFFALLVACLGLFGLATLTVAGRTKEIGIRKVVGASAWSVTGLISRDFAKLVVVAVGLAAPAAYFAMSRWLEGFAYRVEIRPGLVLLTGALVLALALLTVGFQAVKAALADPVETLRYE